MPVESRHMEATAPGGVLFTGYTTSSFYLARLDAAGATLYAQSFSSAGMGVTSVAAGTPSNGTIFAASYYGTFDFAGQTWSNADPTSEDAIVAILSK